ncbi:hypothetical protein [Actinoplanes sp. N902-109]|uniref:hypothetical protein n=1 Tax=Actinoplanes sp. (strain N902-109) TaxID=649831 RepID=UPI000329507B|nr:hypothetical protein [Actinoplanes sp. N902-109]AGL20820.1 hypothetical protein L083_7310 [Actinoplanes sp. N902-109]
MRMPRPFRAAVLAAAVSAGLLGSAGAPAHAADASVAVPNPSFDEGWLGAKLKCWNVGTAGLGKLTVTKVGNTGSAAYASAAGSPLELASDRTDACRIPVAAGRQYKLRFWARSTAGFQPVVSAYDPVTGWKRWHTGAPVAPAASLLLTSLDLPVVPEGVDRISVGWSIPATGVLVVDDVSLTDSGPAPAGPLFRPSFSTAGLVTNEYAYWNSNKTGRVGSPDWEMTSGSLFARNGNGYTGRIDAVSPNATSTSSTDSAVFRLNTRDYSFGDVKVSMNLNMASLTTTTRTPAVDWDGVHIFLHYQSQYELYYASVARRDGHVVIKKKCLGGPSNGGSYYPLGRSEVSGRALPLNTWEQVGASIKTNADGSVTIVLFRDGKAVSTATDTGTGCAPITAPGATGIRGDNAEFEFSDFEVTSLS